MPFEKLSHRRAAWNNSQIEYGQHAESTSLFATKFIYPHAYKNVCVRYLRSAHSFAGCVFGKQILAGAWLRFDGHLICIEHI